jgi:hypothetical protein
MLSGKKMATSGDIRSGFDESCYSYQLIRNGLINKYSSRRHPLTSPFTGLTTNNRRTRDVTAPLEHRAHHSHLILSEAAPGDVVVHHVVRLKSRPLATVL